MEMAIEDSENSCPIVFEYDGIMESAYTQFGKEKYYIGKDEYFLGVYFDGEPIYGHVFPSIDVFKTFQEEIFARLKRTYTFHASTETNLATGYSEKIMWENDKVYLINIGFKSGNKVPRYNVKGIHVRLTHSITKLITGQN